MGPLKQRGQIAAILRYYLIAAPCLAFKNIMYLGFSFANVGNDLRIYLTLMVTNCSGEW